MTNALLAAPEVVSPRVTVGFAREDDLHEISEIAKKNFCEAENYRSLGDAVISKFIERNSADNLHKKLRSGHHRFVVARDGSSQRVVGFFLLKTLNETCVLSTRMHVAAEHQSSKVATRMYEFALETLRREGFELLYGDASGKAAEIFCRAGFLHVDTLVNGAVENTHINRVVIDVQARQKTALAESAFIPHLSPASAYALFVDRYGLLLERLFRQIERMHETGSSGIRQSVFEHVRNGLVILGELRRALEGSFADPIRWDEVETMWIVHDIGEIGMVADTPSFMKTSVDRRTEEAKSFNTLRSIVHRELRDGLVDLYARYTHQKPPPDSGSDASVDREAALCKLVDKLEAATFIGASGIARVWQERAGNDLFEHILRANALGAFLEPAGAIGRCLDRDGRDHLRRRLAEVVAVYRNDGVISESFFEERLGAIARALASPRD